MLETPLRLDPVLDGALLLVPLGDTLALPGDLPFPVLELIKGPQAGLHRQLGDLDGHRGLMPPSAGAG